MPPKRYGASPSDWTHFDFCLGLTADLLPVVSNPNAVVSPNSKLHALGKVPSLYNKNGQVIGIKNWTEKQATSAEIAAWSGNPDYGICLQTRCVRAFDIDVPDPQLADTIYKYFNGFGFARRIRKNSGKFLFAFILKGDFTKRSFKTTGGIVEFLATGQQFVAIGAHESGTSYAWEDGLPTDFVEIQAEEFEKIWSHFVRDFAIEPPTEVGTRKPKTETDTALVNADDVAKWLENNDKVISFGDDHQLFIECPFKAEHTADSGETETAYFPAGTRDYAMGHFRCMHAHCADRDDTDFLNGIGYTASFFEALPPIEPVRGKFDIIDVTDFVNRRPVDWLVKGVLPRNALTMEYGGSGDGKTFVTLDMCMAICRGVDWNDRKVNKGRVIYVCAEGAGGFVSRVKAYCKEYEIDIETLKNTFGIITDVPNFRAPADVKLIIERAKAWGDVDLIVIDTLAQTITGADENSGKDMSVALKCAETLQKTLNTTVKLIHHAGKDEDRGARGWSGMKGPLDAQFWVYREGEQRTFWLAKQKDARDGYGWSFTLANVALGMDEDGDLIESCVVRWVGESSGKQKVSGRKLGANEALIMDVFNELGGDKITAVSLFDEVKKRLPHDGAKRDRRVDLINQALGKLRVKGELEVYDGYAYVPTDGLSVNL